MQVAELRKGGNALNRTVEVSAILLAVLDMFCHDLLSFFQYRLCFISLLITMKGSFSQITFASIMKNFRIDYLPHVSPDRMNSTRPNKFVKRYLHQGPESVRLQQGITKAPGSHNVHVGNP